MEREGDFSPSLIRVLREQQGVCSGIASLQTEVFFDHISIGLGKSGPDQVKFSNFHGVKYPLADVIQIKYNSGSTKSPAVKAFVVFQQEFSKVGLNFIEGDTIDNLS